MSIFRFCLLTTLAIGSYAWSAEPTIDFNKDIRPLLSSKCVLCHGPDEAERAADLRLDTQDGSRADLGGYAAIKPGDPEESELIARIVSTDPDTRMPPEGEALNEKEVQLLRAWINQGAKYAKHWSYEKPVRPKLPTVAKKTWPKNAIDYFTLAKIEAAGLQPSPRADRLTLARRVAMDLTGLPPTWEEAHAFAQDTRRNAYEIFVDQQLEKPSYGERWAQVWLDLARYADSAGYADDPPRTIWAFRDYVIRSLNANKRFDQFTIEQIAGDLLPDPTDEQLIATAFHRNTLTNNEGGTNDEEFRNVAVVDRVNTTMAVWMGTTMACAQCHTHKYDPITHEEYFRFFAFFNSTEDADRRNESPLLEVWSEEQEQVKADWQSQIAELKQTLDTDTPKLQTERQKWLASVQTEPTWDAQKPSSANAKNRSLSIEDNWIAATDDKPENDTYTINIPTNDRTVSAVQINVPAEQKDNFVVSRVRAVWTPKGKKSIDARYVRVEIPGKKKFLHLAELQAFSGGENVALKGKASQISTDYGGVVKRLNDGNTNGDYSKNSVTHTAEETNPWAEIDFGSTQPIDRVVVWNRTDGQTSDRLSGFRVQLLDENHDVIWEQSPKAVPSPSGTYASNGQIEFQFGAALADYEQNGFPASSVIGQKLNAKTGWAVAGQTGKPHELTLLLKKPVQLTDGILTVYVLHASVHKNHLLNRFSIALTDDKSAATWAKMPGKIRDLIRGDAAKWTDKQKEQVAAYHRTIARSLLPTQKRLADLEKKLAGAKPTTTVPIMRDRPADKKRVTKIQIRGNYQSTGDEVTEGTPAVFHSLPDGEKADRLALAKWLVDDENPLTARVIANRHWEQIFGTGIVLTSEEFGSQGDLPSHPQLLDWLAVELRESGWDLKAFVKMMVMSATYQQSSATTPDLQEADPFNRLLARGARFRVSAEMIRDQALFVSGLLSKKMFGPPVKPPQPELGLKAAFGSATDWKTSSGVDKYRRGLYTTWRRSSPYPSMAQFDAPNREVCTVRRIRTNTPLQALVTLNDPVYIEAAQALARKCVAEGNSDRERIELAFKRALIREPSYQESERLLKLIEEATKFYLSQTEDAAKMATEPLGKLPDGANVAEMAAWTVVANVILNLDEMFMKR